MLRQQQSELEREEKEKKLQLIQRLKNIENSQPSSSPNDKTPITPFASTPLNRPYNQAPVTPYSRQNSKTGGVVSNYKFMYSENVDNSSKNTNTSGKLDFKRDDTEAQLNAILGGTRERRKQVQKQDQVSSNFNSEGQISLFNGKSSRSTSRIHNRQTPNHYDRERSDKSLMSVPDISKLELKTRSANRYDTDIEELLL